MNTDLTDLPGVSTSRPQQWLLLDLTTGTVRRGTSEGWETVSLASAVTAMCEERQ